MTAAEWKKGVGVYGRQKSLPVFLQFEVCVLCSGMGLSQEEETTLSLLLLWQLGHWMWQHQMAGEVLGLRWALWLSFVIHSAVPRRFRAVVLAGQVPPCAQTEKLWRDFGQTSGERQLPRTPVPTEGLAGKQRGV